MEKYRDDYEHHWIIEMSDEGIEEARKYFKKYFECNNGDFFECNEKRSKKGAITSFCCRKCTGADSML